MLSAISLLAARSADATLLLVPPPGTYFTAKFTTSQPSNIYCCQECLPQPPWWGEEPRNNPPYCSTDLACSRS